MSGLGHHARGRGLALSTRSSALSVWGINIAAKELIPILPNRRTAAKCQTKLRQGGGKRERRATLPIVRRRPTRLVPLFFYWLRLQRDRRVTLGLGMAATGALLAALSGAISAMDPAPRLATPDLSAMGPHLVIAWRDDRTQQVRVGARTAGKWVVGPIDLGPADGDSQPRVTTTEQGAAVAWRHHRSIHLAVFGRPGGRVHRSRISLGSMQARGLAVHPAADGWQLLWNDAGQIRWQRFDTQARALGTPRDIVRAQSFDSTPASQGLAVVTYRARGARFLVLDADGKVLSSELFSGTAPPQSASIAASRTAVAIAEVYARQLCVRAAGGSCRRTQATAADLAAIEESRAWLVLHADAEGIHSSVVKLGLRRPHSIDEVGTAPRVIRAGEGIYAAVWEHNGYIRAAMLNSRGQVQLFKDLAP